MKEKNGSWQSRDGSAPNDDTSQRSLMTRVNLQKPGQSRRDGAHLEPQDSCDKTGSGQDTCLEA